MEYQWIAWGLCGGAVLLLVSGGLLGRASGNGLLGFGYSFWLMKRFVMKRIGYWDIAKEAYEKLYVNENPAKEIERQGCRQGLCVVALCIGVAAVLLLLGERGAFSPEEVRELSRPELGSRLYQLQARTQGRQYDLSLMVEQRQLREEDFFSLTALAREKLPEWILGENAGLDAVSAPLVLMTRIPGTVLPISWYSTDYRHLTPQGQVNTADLEEETKEVVLRADISYGDWKEQIVIPVTLVRRGEGNTSNREQVNTAIQEVVAKQAEQQTVLLPEQVDGAAITYFIKAEQSPYVWLGFLGVVLVFYFLTGVSRSRRQTELRKKQLEKDYPEIVSKLTLLLEAGMTIRFAWERITLDYGKHMRGRKEKRYAYEEMILVRNQLKLGMPESEAYSGFGRRCGTIRYLRFGSVLVQNLQKGSGSIVPLLKKEAAEALCERKEQARQLGEEAGTKLLLPMGGFLILVLAIVMVPALLSF